MQYLFPSSRHLFVVIQVEASSPLLKIVAGEMFISSSSPPPSFSQMIPNTFAEVSRSSQSAVRFSAFGKSLQDEGASLLPSERRDLKNETAVIRGRNVQKKKRNLNFLESAIHKLYNFAQSKSRHLRRLFPKNSTASSSTGGNSHSKTHSYLYESKDYQRIKSHVYSIKVRNYAIQQTKKNNSASTTNNNENGVLLNGEKIMIKRRILNDYMNVINKRSEIVGEIERNLEVIMKMHSHMRAYFQRYYQHRNNMQYERLASLLLPEFKYILKFVSNKGKQFQARLFNSSQNHEKAEAEAEVALGSSRKRKAERIRARIKKQEDDDKLIIDIETLKKKDSQPQKKQPLYTIPISTEQEI